MIKPNDLLDVARDLAKLDAHRPRQASLRRATLPFRPILLLMALTGDDVIRER